MKKTIIALSLAAFALGSAAPAFAGSSSNAGATSAAKDVPCTPVKKGYIMVDGKCVRKPAAKTQ